MADQVVAKGVNGQLTVTDRTVVIERKGVLSFMTQGLKGAKEIPIDRIAAVQMKNAGMLTNGYLQLTIVGGIESRGGVFDAVKDENTVVFNKGQQASFDRAKALIQERMQAPMSPATSAADELAKFAALHKQGVLTDEEFSAKKKALLGI